MEEYRLVFSHIFTTGITITAIGDDRKGSRGIPGAFLDEMAERRGN
ncbi:MAG: hypothetical protein IKA23_06035 [Akkermansia sp.]|nr:hypothetical protein [Akkermansia sp.]